MKRVPGWIAALLKYAAGILCWAGIFAYLQVQCIFNVGSFVDGLWMRDLHSDLADDDLLHMDLLTPRKEMRVMR